jgi:thymidylate synthase (FAD)
MTSVCLPLQVRQAVENLAKPLPQIGPFAELVGDDMADAEEHIAYIARVSNPKNQDNPSFEGLLKYCVKHGHISIFEQANMCVEVITPLAIATQLLRHRSMTYQQLSLRYSTNDELKDLLGEYGSLYYVPEVARLQDTKNRQNSIESDDPALTDAMWSTMETSYKVADMAYQDLLEKGVAKEVARLVLPQGTFTRLYVSGSVRSWMTYLKVRDEPGVVQHEHVELAQAIKTIFATQFPTVNKAWFTREPSPLERENAELRIEIEVLKATLRGTL